MLREMEHNAKRDSGVHPAHLKGWQQSRKQLVVPALALHLLDRFGAVCEWLGGRPWLLSCSHGCCPHWAGELIWILDAAGVFGWLSVPNECLQQFVNRSPLSKSDSHWHFPLPSLSGMISHLFRQGSPAFSSFQQSTPCHCHSTLCPALLLVLTLLFPCSLSVAEPLVCRLQMLSGRFSVCGSSICKKFH